MKTWQIVVLVVAVLIVLAVAAYLAYRWYQKRQRHARLRERYGNEYDRVVAERGGRSQADAELERRERERATLDVRPLSPQRRAWFGQRWERTQAGFVEDPHGAVADADALVTDLMRERGYPTDDFDRQTELLSVDHANVIEDYRQAHELARLGSEATTEELRRATMHYRSLFAALLAPESETGGQHAGDSSSGETVDAREPRVARPGDHVDTGRDSAGDSAGDAAAGRAAAGRAASEDPAAGRAASGDPAAGRTASGDPAAGRHRRAD